MRMEAGSARLLLLPLPALARGEGWGEGLSPRILMLADRPVPPHPDRKGDPTSPRKRGGVKKHRHRPSIAAIIHRVILLEPRSCSAARRSSGASALPCATATRRSQQRETATPTAVCRKPSDVLRSYALIRPG